MNSLTQASFVFFPLFLPIQFLEVGLLGPTVFCRYCQVLFLRDYAILHSHSKACMPLVPKALPLCGLTLTLRCYES